MSEKKPVIKDSGTRQQFSTGAHRDIQEGKGRYDLLPALALKRVAQHFEAGGIKYVIDNWKKGIPMRRMMDSAIRHSFKALYGLEDEDHLAAAAWNLLCAIEIQMMIRAGILPEELDDLPRFKDQKQLEAIIKYLE